jgi:HSP20 family protein
MQAQTGRMLRSMSLTRMMPFETTGYQPPVDVYQAEDEVYVYCDLAGTAPESIELLAAEHQLRISGRRQLPPQKSIACIHQLEIELGGFERTISLPTQIDVNRVQSDYSNGILTVILPSKRKKGKVKIEISS